MNQGPWKTTWNCNPFSSGTRTPKQLSAA